MHSVQEGMWDPQPPSKHASPLPPAQPSSSSLHRPHVIADTPAKRITFYKSGDSQFGGVRMAVHKRSFKCFDALLDDLSQKVPLPFGVRTVTTPRGTHTIKHLEQLQDGGCYLCSDRRQAKPINMELARKHPGIWYNDTRRPHRPETSSSTATAHFPYRQRRILLVKNSEPGIRRSLVLSRRSTRSLRAFLDEVSEVMQFHVRKLYTAEGRRIESVQSLMTCSGVLVCVGREAFSPMLVNFIRKSSDERLPGLNSRSPGLGPRTPGNGARSPGTQGLRSPPHGAQSRASEYSEVHESRKNVNFGLETKKSIIHPRSDSSNRSARFSLSSEKSYGNGVSAYSQAKPAIMNEDIEKRVLVNKDGSLSVEMRVRFRLHSDETLQWSTQIKKSPSLTNECCPLSQAQPHYLQHGQSESCSDPDSASYEQEGVHCSSQTLQHAADGNSCPCCYQRQEQQYDFWENPVHSCKPPPVPPQHAHSHSHTMMRHTHSSSSSSSCNSRRVVRCRARLSNCSGTEKQLVQEEMCVTEQVERRVEVEQDGGTHVEVCRVSRCSSRSEVVAADSNLRPHSGKSIEEDVLMEVDRERPISAVSSSSHVLQSLKEDQDDAQPTGHEDGEESGSRVVSAASSCHCGEATVEDVDRAPSSKSKMSTASCRSSKTKIQNSEDDGTADDEDDEIKRVGSSLSGHTGISLQSRASSVCPDCGGCKRGSNYVSSKPATPQSNQVIANNGSENDGSDFSTQSNKTNLTNSGRISAISNLPEDRASSATSHRSERSDRDGHRSPSARSAKSDTETGDSDSGKSTVSFNMNTESKGRVKTTTPATNTKKTSMKENVEGRGSTRSRKSNNNGNKSITPPKTPAVDIPTIETPGGIEDKGEDDLEPRCERSTSTAKVSNADVPNHRTPTAMSSASAKVGSKTKSKNQAPSRPASKTEGEEDNKAASVHSKSQCCLMPESAASAHLGSKVKESIGGDPAKPDSMDAVKSPKAKSTGSVNSRPQSKLALIKSSSPCPLHNSRPSSKEEDCSESTLSHSLSAADLLKEAIAARPHSRQSKASKASGKTRSEKCQRSRNQRGHVETPDLTPACLPNASPNEVVSEWLASIPTDSSMLTLGDEMNEDEDLLVEKAMDEKPGEEVSKEEESPEEGRVDNGENVEAKEEEEEEEEEKVEEAESDALDEKCLDQPPGDKVANSSSHNHLLSSRESLPKNWHSSAAVMKVLLGSSLGRCRSMPEVSPVYGRRLSTSARGLLDCLAQLQLIEPAVGPERDCQKPHNHHYQDIMTILQSLWLAEPENISTKDSGGDQITPPRSSSGVDMSSGSAGSGKENGNQGEDETNKIEAKETESLHEDEEVDKVADVEDGESEEPKEAETEPEETSTEQFKIDTAEPVTSEEQNTVPNPKATENPSSSEKSSANSSSKSPTDNEQETLEDSSSGTPPTVLRAPLAKKLSQDPDPVWILHLLKKLEKQFMNHYITAMAEFKVRWDLDDSLILDTMISELKDEVSRRIQSSIEREMQKIQGRAGKGGRSPRPPMGGNLSRESTMTEKRRRMLKVMKNQSVKTADSLSDGENTADFSDQRSDDEYCPCDACVRKKMAARPLKTNPLAAEAPVMMEFDLLKILQLKKSPFPTPAAVPQVDVVEEGEGEGESNLEVVEEEEEEDETKEDIKADGAEEEECEVSDSKPEEEEGETTGKESEEEEEPARESEDEKEAANEESKLEEESVEENGGASGEAEDEDDGDDGTGEEKEGESGEQEVEASEEERTSPQGQGVTEGEEADAEDSDTDAKRPSDTSVDDSGQDGAEATGEEEENDSGGGGEGDVVEEFKPEEGEEGDVDGNKKEDGALLQQFTRTSVESQPGSLEDIDSETQKNHMQSIVVPKMAAGVSTGGGSGNRRSRSPARVKRCKPKTSDVELGDF
nr:retinitis pigmentosa 1-like 1 protein [Labrus bergylta]